MSIIRVSTQTSMYDVDIEGKRVRRVAGVDPPTERQGEDWVWRPFVNIWLKDRGIVFQWGWNENGSANCTWTSDIVAVEEVADVEAIDPGAGS